MPDQEQLPQKITLSLDQRLQDRLDHLKAAGSFRSLKTPSATIDFSSNDYLGLGRRRLCSEQLILPSIQTPNGLKLGSCGSRLLSGNSVLHEQLEEELAEFYQGEAALLCNSGYCANLSVCQALFDRHDTVLYDELIHASLRDGITLARAKGISFRHNNLQDLEDKLRRLDNVRYVLVESVYSMDGDGPDFSELLRLTGQFGCSLIVDEAHGVGVYGPGGRGVLAELGLTARVPVRIYTFGKALGSFGAVVVGSKVLKDTLINFARPFIYATALPQHQLALIQDAHRQLSLADKERAQIKRLVDSFREQSARLPEEVRLSSSTPIQGLLIPGNAKVSLLAEKLQSNDFDVRPVRSPTVPAGSERLRVILHAYNSPEEIEGLISCVRSELSTGY